MTYKCPKCGETFEGKLENCPHCNAKLSYVKKDNPPDAQSNRSVSSEKPVDYESPYSLFKMAKFSQKNAIGYMALFGLYVLTVIVIVSSNAMKDRAGANELDIIFNLAFKVLYIISAILAVLFFAKRRKLSSKTRLKALMVIQVVFTTVCFAALLYAGFLMLNPSISATAASISSIIISVSSLLWLVTSILLLVFPHRKKKELRAYKFKANQVSSMGLYSELCQAKQFEEEEQIKGKIDGLYSQIAEQERIEDEDGNPNGQPLEEGQVNNGSGVINPSVGVSSFDGLTIVRVLIKLLCVFLSIITFGICIPWAICFYNRWMCKHTRYDGHQLEFVGTFGKLFLHFLKWILLSIVTFGIYFLFMSYNMAKWTAANTKMAGVSGESKLGGNVYSFIGVKLVGIALTIVTLGIYSGVAKANYLEWKYNNSKISGRRLSFNNDKYEYVGKNIVWNLLTIITLFIFGFFAKTKRKKWEVERTHILRRN